MANGLRSLSGQQWLGPNTEAWLVLDPDRRYEDSWNRGASYVSFRWAPPGARTEIHSPQQDQVVPVADPCAPALGRLGLRAIVSSNRLVSPCLVQLATFSFGGVTRRVYRLGAGG
jgi:hypothetical protein